MRCSKDLKNQGNSKKIQRLKKNICLFYLRNYSTSIFKVVETDLNRQSHDD